MYEFSRIELQQQDGQILANFPSLRTSAHEVTFNMSYLYFGNTSSYISQVDKTQGNLSLVSPSYFDLNADGSLKITSQFDEAFVTQMHARGIKVVPFLSNHWDRTLGRQALANREKLSSQLAEFIVTNNLDGIQVDIENVTDLDRDAYTDLVRLLREKLPSNKEVSVAVAANPNGWTKGWHGSYDYKELAKYANYLMIMAYDESYSGGPQGPVASYGWVERSIQYSLNQGVAADKIVLGIPFYGRYWKEGQATGGAGISNHRVDEMLAKYGGTVSYDETSQSPKATISIKPGDPTISIAGTTLTAGTYHIWYENHESIKAKLQLIHKYNLKGSGSWSLGQESSSIWQSYRTWLSHDGQVEVSPVSDTQPKEQAGSTAPSTAITHIVQSGDTLWKIAASYKMSVDELKAWNNLTTDAIFIGQALKVKSLQTSTQQPVPSEPAANTPGAVSALGPLPAPVPVPSPKPAITPPRAPAPAVAAPAKKYPTLRVGSSGAAVTDMQNKLKKVGIYKGSVHGKYDTSTRNAVIAFQKKYKLKADGIAGPATLSKLDAVIAPTKAATTSKPAVVSVKKYPTLRTGSKGTAVKDMQSKLKKNGVYRGNAHGTYDAATRNAVIVFQKKYKLKADGIAGPTTLSKLDSVTK
ncbi:peptidoglycan-binding protein [Robertmurraya korlensis]|uniref:peptidoglycan-binding protein n=1 Tax=Robertmurraya korlensis TaxID=519977 RepID=UPI0009FE305A|nr:peptidoglycan-binding protein [Robertmurraya korlensis]